MVSNDTNVLNHHLVPQVATGQHAGIIFIEQRVSAGDSLRFLLSVARTETMQSMAGQIRYYVPTP